MDIDDGVFECWDDSTKIYYFTTATLYVPVGTKGLYEAAKGWSLFQNIVEMDEDFQADVKEISDEVQSSGGTYDLNGRMVRVPTAKGVYIIKGKKVVVK